MNNYRSIKSEWDDKVPKFRDKVSKLLNADERQGKDTTRVAESANNGAVTLPNDGKLNPFVGKNGKLVNPYINYQAILDGNNVSSKVKNFIQQATGLTPKTHSVSPVGSTTGGSNNSPVTLPNYTPVTGGGDFSKLVGQRITDTSSYNNGAAKGQCVWFVKGRIQEKLGITLGAMGNGNQMYTNAKSEAQLAPTVDNIKPNLIVSYGKGTGSAGQKYGHVIFIEDVVGDTVYYTEGGSGYYKNGTDGVVKTASRQGIIDGINSNGKRMGSEIMGFVDVSKYR